MPDTFSEFLRTHREELGIPVARFAELVGRSPSTVRGWERGRSRPGDPQTIGAVAAVLGVEEDALAALVAGEEVVVSPTEPVVREEPAVMSGPAPRGIEQDALWTVSVGSPLERERVRRVPLLPRPPRRFVVLRADRGVRYQLRALGTILGVVVLLVMLQWALGEFRESLGDLKDSVFGP